MPDEIVLELEHGEFTLHAEAVLLLQGRDDFAIGQAVGGLDDDVLREFVLSLVDDGFIEGEVQKAFVRIGFCNFDERARLAPPRFCLNLQALSALHLLDIGDDALLFFGKLHIIPLLLSDDGIRTSRHGSNC